MIHSRLLPLFVACIGFSFNPVAAQPRMVELKFITFPQCQKPIEMELLVAKDKTVKLEIPSNELSQTYRLPRLNNLVFGESSVDEEGNFKFDIFGKGAMAAATKQTVLILRKGAEPSQGFEVRSVASDEEDFGGGKFLFLNATGKPIAGFLGRKNRFALNPGRHAILKPVLEKDGRRAYIEFYYMGEGEDGAAKPVPFFNSFWPVSENSRGFVFFYQDPVRDNRITFHSYRDFLIELEDL